MEPTYLRTTLFQTDYFEVVSCEWGQGDASPLHGHGSSQCFALVEEGVFENFTDFGLKKELSIKEPGQVIVTPAGARHEIRCKSVKGRTLHVYTPKISASQNKKLNFKTPEEADIKAVLELKLGAKGVTWERLEKLFNGISEHSISTSSPYFMNQLFSGVHSHALAAENLIAKTKTTMATFEASPVVTLIETEVVQSLCQKIGWPDGSADGVTVPGGSSANFMAVHCARQRKFPDYKQKGMPSQKLKVFASEEAHYSLKKACVVLGLGLDALVLLKTDLQGKIEVEDLDHKIKKCLKDGDVPLIVYATAGTTVLGAFDPISEMADLCQKYSIWLHVDAAWGGPALFSDQGRPLMNGVSASDSMTFDAHKFFGAGLTCSFFLTKQPQVLFEANDVAGGDYLFHDSETMDRGRLTWQCGRRADAVSFWTLWKSLGDEGLGQSLDRCFTIRDDLVQWIKEQPRLHLVAEPYFLNICVQILPPSSMDEKKDWSLKVRNHLKENDLAMVNYAADQKGNSFLRMILAHPELQLQDVKNILTWALDVL